MSKKLTNYCFKNNISKLTYVKQCVNENRHIEAIKIVARFPRLVKALDIVKCTAEAISEPRWEKILLKGLSTKEAIVASITAIKTEYKFS